MSEIYRGSYFCKAISYSVSGPPARSNYCHCTLCQRMHGAPFVHSTHFPSSQFQWTHAEPHTDHIEEFQNPIMPWKYRVRCKRCGVMVAGRNTKTDRVNVFPVQMERDEEGKVKGWEKIKPAYHIFYDTRVLDVNDGLPKWSGYAEGSTLMATD